MANIVHVRIDGRLIHGQVCTQWIDKKGARRIIIVDDIIARDAFLVQICTMASPVGTKLEVISCEEAAKRWKENTFTNEPMFVLFQTCEMALKAWQAGFKYPSLNFGTTLNKGNMIFSGVGSIKIKPEHLTQLDDAANEGLDIYFQVTPNDPKQLWKTLKDKMYQEAGINGK